MAKVLISIGSNIEPATQVRKAVGTLLREFAEVRLSSVYESRAVGFSGDNFLNLVACVETDQGLAQLQGLFKRIEIEQGRDLNAAKFTPRTIDLDILLYDNVVQQGDTARDQPQLPRAEITYNAFVLRPLAELVPNWQHPILKQTYASLWREFSATPQADEQELWPVSFDWTGVSLSARAQTPVAEAPR
ncbi:MAG: 2-amino-4-hydroxy-6-hydroxymethyldihydropteridine diphosphokinase [Idiomarina sp.]|nr:2-amino-4-hydroxy-6-hydroxymethyldihydropteridine diphosphokinase [Idiomarina sp.]